MAFGSLLFTYVFLPLALFAVYAAKGAKSRNAVLLAASLCFFAWGAPKFVFALVALCAMDYALSKGIARAGSASGRAKALCAFGVAANLAVLAFFKYTDFAIDSANAILRLAGAPELRHAGILLPLGISFFTFQKISYLVDVRRGVSKPAETFWKYLLYIALFPQLILGPIIRYHEIEHQLDDRATNAEGFLSGLWRFALGFARKMLVAGPLALVADAAFDASAAGRALTAPAAWAGLYAYTLQIYFDFAGYSDMAVGIGRMLGFKFPENFNAPYVSRDMAEFWRRWHMTLGSFMKEYLYIPLGGNRCPRARSLFNNWLVFLASGIWHGAAWNFVAWGAWHGLWIMVAKLRKTKFPARFAARHLPAMAFTLLMAMLGWVFFRAATFHDAATYFASLFSKGGATYAGTLLAQGGPHALAALAVGTFFAFAPALLPRLGLAEWEISGEGKRGEVFARTFLTALLILLSTLPLLASGFNPFIYFRF